MMEAEENTASFIINKKYKQIPRSAVYRTGILSFGVKG